MDLETIQTFDHLEDGEIEDDNSDDCYIPLQRPAAAPRAIPDIPTNDPYSADEDDFHSSGDSDSDDCFKSKATRKKRTVLVRTSATEATATNQKFKKFQIWAKTLEEDCLAENMRGIGVDQNAANDRSVETYDYNLKYRLKGQKRQLSDDNSEDSNGPSSKRSKSSYSSKPKKRPVKERLGPKKNSSESSDLEYDLEPRILSDLTNCESDDAAAIAREIAFNLFEEKDELILRLVSVVGIQKAVALFKETQRIEKEGGMMIVNGKRRRTPGGVYFFLLKHDDQVTSAQRKMIFYEENKVAIKDKKTLQAMKRDQKVEELKKRLTEQEHLPLPILSSASSNENNLSNPPPSPVVDHDKSPEYKSHAINDVDKLEESVINDVEKLEAVKQSRNDSGLDGLTSYDDDFLDITCDDMEIM